MDVSLVLDVIISFNVQRFDSLLNLAYFPPPADSRRVNVERERMYQSRIHKHVEPMPLSTVDYFRNQLRCAVSDQGAPLLHPVQALLCFSLTYGAGGRPEEIAKMQLSSMLDGNGDPASEVRFEASVTKHRVPRRVPMHPDIRADLLAFIHCCPEQRLVAFRTPGVRGPQTNFWSGTFLTEWFRRRLRAAGLGCFSLSSGRKTYLALQRPLP